MYNLIEWSQILIDVWNNVIDIEMLIVWKWIWFFVFLKIRMKNDVISYYVKLVKLRMAKIERIQMIEIKWIFIRFIIYLFLFFFSKIKLYRPFRLRTICRMLFGFWLSKSRCFNHVFFPHSFICCFCALLMGWFKNIFNVNDLQNV